MVSLYISGGVKCNQHLTIEKRINADYPSGTIGHHIERDIS